MIRVLRMLRTDLHARAYALQVDHPEAAHALWALVDSLDTILTRLRERSD